MRRDLGCGTEARQTFTEKLNELALDHPAGRGSRNRSCFPAPFKEGEPVTVDPLFFVQGPLLHTDSVLRTPGTKLEVIAISR
ncbi:hypothetical protein ACIRPH_04705 [Nocardiopsis sp. NPDC101807]|uniref:hypothetical protein n=1 Tax=Nocardiopsis sp. NPDC101807 TaxID=3364339 RepID=UPI00382A434E